MPFAGLSHKVAAGELVKVTERVPWTRLPLRSRSVAVRTAVLPAVRAELDEVKEMEST